MSFRSEYFISFSPWFHELWPIIVSADKALQKLINVYRSLFAHIYIIFEFSCDNELNVEIKLTAEPGYLDMFVRLFAVGDEDNPLFGVGGYTMSTQPVEQICSTL
ncbi:MAG: hypothetical protein K2L28_10720 [Muribaculaceae bacterium]|nr:hypothetical protein [Muribaculaceae bacterium]